MSQIAATSAWNAATSRAQANLSQAAANIPSAEGLPSEQRKAFDSFVGQTFYGQMLTAMRQTVGKPAYFHGGRGEEVFQGQLDQVLAEHMTTATAHKFTGPMYELFTASRR